MGKLIVVSNRLPVRINSSGEAERTTGGLASAMEGATEESEQWWVGWPGVSLEELPDAERTRETMRSTGLEPVFLSAEEQDGFYEGFSNSTLWPVLHYMVERAKFSSNWWRIYRTVNRKFADHILAIAKPGDRVWIHDYHLMLTPSMVRSEGIDLKIGFFLHTPFCSSEIFRVLPNRSEILIGLLGADLIGFHTFGYLRHFRSALLRVLGLETEMESIRYEDRKIQIRVFPIGHNHEAVESATRTTQFEAALSRTSGELDGKKMILNVERLDYTKGLPEKLSAMRRFLELHPDRAKEVIFLLIAVPSRQGVEEYDHLTEEVQREVGALNGEFGTFGHTVIQFLHRSFPMEELAAFYALSEVCMVTPLRDGMNLVAKEFMDCQRREIRSNPGVLILSEFAGATHQLPQAIHVNPHDCDEVACAINRALDMDHEERWQRIDQMRSGLVEQDNRFWARNFLADLNLENDRTSSLAMSNLKPLVAQVVDSLKGGRTTGIFLDYDGTLRDFVDIPAKATPDRELLQMLETFAAIEHLQVAIVSGRKPDFLSKHFGSLGLTLVGEHGYRFKTPGNRDWHLLNPHVNVSWKENMLPHLIQASRLTPGTHVEEKQSALVFHYRKADPEFGDWRTTSLLEELTDMAANLPVTVHHGNKIVEVSSLQVSKGAAVDFLINQWDCKTALVAGDDQTDETMLSLRPSNVEFHSIKIGNGPTQAELRTDIVGLRHFLESLHAELS